MIAYFRRWWRSLWAPKPLPGQTWEIDGVGPVVVERADVCDYLYVRIHGAEVSMKRADLQMFGRMIDVPRPPVEPGALSLVEGGRD